MNIIMEAKTHFYVFFFIVFGLFTPSVEGVLCNRCLHNGIVLMPTNIFGSCRCLCRRGFGGPICQFQQRYIRRKSGQTKTYYDSWKQTMRRQPGMSEFDTSFISFLLGIKARLPYYQRLS